MGPFWLGCPGCRKLTAAPGEPLLLGKAELKSGTFGAQRLYFTVFVFELTNY